MAAVPIPRRLSCAVSEAAIAMLLIAARLSGASAAVSAALADALADACALADAVALAAKFKLASAAIGSALIAIWSDAIAFGANRFTPKPDLIFASAASRPIKLARLTGGTVSAGGERLAIALTAAVRLAIAPGKARLIPSAADKLKAAETLALTAALADAVAEACAASAACN